MTHPSALISGGIQGRHPGRHCGDPVVATCPVCGLRVRRSKWWEYPYPERSGARRAVETRGCASPCAGSLVVAYVDGCPQPVAGDPYADSTPGPEGLAKRFR